MNGIWWLKPTVEILEKENRVVISTTQVTKWFSGYSKPEFESQFKQTRTHAESFVNDNLARARLTLSAKVFDLFVSSLTILWMAERHRKESELEIKEYISHLRPEFLDVINWVLRGQQKLTMENAASVVGVDAELLRRRVESYFRSINSQ